jgi:hypothetical protein
LVDNGFGGECGAKLDGESLKGLSSETAIPFEGDFELRLSRLLSQEDVEGDHRLVKICLE